MNARVRARKRYGRIVARTLAGLIALAIVALILRGVAEASSEAGGTRHTAAVGIPLLVEASRTQANYQVGLERALLERDLPTRITLLQGILAQRDETKTAWNQARPTLTAQPDAAAAVAHYDDAMAQLDRLGDVTSQLATSIDPDTVGADPRLVEVRAAGDLQRAALAELTAIELRTSVVAPTDAVMHQLSTISSITEIWIAIAALGLLFVAARAMRVVRQETAEAVQFEITRAVEMRRSTFEQDLTAALAMSSTEGSALEVTIRALRKVDAEGAVELLLADSSQAHLDPALAVYPEGAAPRLPGPLCSVRTPDECPAVTRGQAIVFRSSEEMSACPNLRNRATGPCSARCVPVTIASRTVGVLHAVGPDGFPPTGEKAEMLDTLVARVGDHLSHVRAAAETEAAASTDALTGLVNRRTFENEFRRVGARRETFALAFGDVDHFKQLNDEHGHDTGDRALRILSRTLRRSLRDGDLVARWGGEEFVLLMCGLRSAEAVELLERIRMNLTLEQASGSIPPFTMSFGVCDDSFGSDLAELIARADAALLIAKQSGRNRVVVADSCAGVAGVAGVSNLPIPAPAVVLELSTAPDAAPAVQPDGLPVAVSGTTNTR